MPNRFWTVGDLHTLVDNGEFIGYNHMNSDESVARERVDVLSYANDIIASFRRGNGGDWRGAGGIKVIGYSSSSVYTIVIIFGSNSIFINALNLDELKAKCVKAFSSTKKYIVEMVVEANSPEEAEDKAKEDFVHEKFGKLKARLME